MILDLEYTELKEKRNSFYYLIQTTNTTSGTPKQNQYVRINDLKIQKVHGFWLASLDKGWVHYRPCILVTPLLHFLSLQDI